MSFDPDTLEPHPRSFTELHDGDEEDGSKDELELTASQPVSEVSTRGAPIAHGRKPRPIPWPKENENEPARACETNRPVPTSATASPSLQNETETAQQILFADGTINHEGPSLEIRP
jgi:hypothetical protein